ncbi:MAG: AlpA family phage regulatory protein [Alphaproteobacteria bacterium]|nr:AlpA family phage regulatory protein [Alphaproteobacteria bacterium]
MPHNVAKQPARRFIRRAELRRMVALGDSTIYEMEKRGEFPRRIALLPRVVVWDLTEVEAWMDKCLSNRSSGSFELTKPAGLAKRKARSSARK